MVDLREYIRESNAIEDVHEESAVDATIGAWEYLRSNDELTHDVVKESHQRIMGDRQPDIAGEYRDVQVYIGEQRPPPPLVVESKMEKLLSWIPAFLFSYLSTDLVSAKTNSAIINAPMKAWMEVRNLTMTICSSPVCVPNKSVTKVCKLNMT